MKKPQIKTTWGFYLTPVRTTKIKKRQQMLVRIYRLKNCYSLLVEVQIVAVTIQMSVWGILIKLESGLPRCATHWYILQKNAGIDANDTDV